MIGEKELTFGTSVIIKGVIPKKRDEKNGKNIRKFKTANTYMKLLFSGNIVGFIPSAVLVESSAVGARLAGSKRFGMNLAKRIEEVCTVLMMKRFWIVPLKSVHNTEPVDLTTFC
jgi:hypothetical protein